ncbi:hypothetical protein BH790_gp58 [Gordonia phage Gsput1]|uniref:Uncharacterized protein n=1 Tax=Gordonia phage Gsput1 TaxID=1622193 RepID=A0A0E3XA24_9CAUD|nr:hypothetical protein BH790_gp58 [Gordonia phage Gsput1]AKC03083.1 hypothetical protein Gsput1_58 [Gordonia phage Gsput1]
MPLDRKALDAQIAMFVELQEWDAELAREHRETRAKFTEVAVSLKALCEAVPEIKDYVTGEIARGQAQA